MAVPRKIRGLCLKARGDSYSLSAQISAGKIWAMEKREDIFIARTIFAIGSSRQEGFVDAMGVPIVKGVWTDVGVTGKYLWGFNSGNNKACIWDWAGREIARMERTSTMAVINKCWEMSKEKK